MPQIRSLYPHELSWFDNSFQVQVDECYDADGQKLICIEKSMDLYHAVFALSKKGYQYYYTINYSLDGKVLNGCRVDKDFVSNNEGNVQEN